MTGADVLERPWAHADVVRHCHQLCVLRCACAGPPSSSSSALFSQPLLLPPLYSVPFWLSHCLCLSLSPSLCCSLFDLTPFASLTQPLSPASSTRLWVQTSFQALGRSLHLGQGTTFPKPSFPHLSSGKNIFTHLKLPPLCQPMLGSARDTSTVSLVVVEVAVLLSPRVHSRVR